MEKTDLQLVNEIRENGCNDSFIELRNRHKALCTKMAAKYVSLLASMGYSPEDIEHEKDVAVYRAVRTYKTKEGDKNSNVNTWIANNVRYHCLNILKKFNKPTITLVTNDKETVEISYSDFNLNMDIDDFVSSLSGCDFLKKKVFIDRYVNNKKIKDIAKENNVSQATIYQYCNQYQSIIKNRLKNEY